MHIYWLRNDLRFDDNTALLQAIQQSDTDKQHLFFLFHIDPAQLKNRGFSYDYFFLALDYFRYQLREKNIRLYIIEGEMDQAFQQLLEQVRPKAIYYNKRECGYGKLQDQRAKQLLDTYQIKTRQYLDKHLHFADDIRKKDGGLYQVFTPYYENWNQRVASLPSRIDEDQLKRVAQDAPFLIDDQKGQQQYQQIIEEIKCRYKKEQLCDFRIGEEAARLQLDHFVTDKLVHYNQNKDMVTKETSGLSQYLSSGEISVRTILQAVKASKQKNQHAYIRQLAWRDFFNMVYAHHDKLNTQEALEKYREIPWNRQTDLFEKWAKGETGFPIVDAAMRKLNQTGRMHNRLRMITASFLVKDLLIDWRMGEAYFRNMLIDYDPASNIGNWQWAASVGFDSVPYFRIFNPSLQSKKYDPDGLFIKAHIPSLQELPAAYIHEPHRYRKKIFDQYNKDIDSLYPKPMVDHKQSRLDAIALYRRSGQIK